MSPPKSLQTLVDFIRTKTGKSEGEVRLFGDMPKVSIKSVSTGIPQLDAALGIGGVPCGRVTEIFGFEQSGKTCLSLHIVAAVQKKGGAGVYIDLEHSFDPKWTANLGVDVSSLVFVQVDTGEEAFDCATAAAMGGADIIVIDSIGAMIPKVHLKTDLGKDAKVGAHATMVKMGMQKLKPAIASNETVLILLNQMRAKIGGQVGFGGAQSQSTGGHAFRHWCDLRLKLRIAGADIDEKEGRRGVDIIAQAVKNKTGGMPYAEAKFHLSYMKGIDIDKSVFMAGVATGVIVKSGSWFSFGDVKVQGEDAFVAQISAQKKMKTALLKALRNAR